MSGRVSCPALVVSVRRLRNYGSEDDMTLLSKRVLLRGVPLMTLLSPLTPILKLSRAWRFLNRLSMLMKTSIRIQLSLTPEMMMLMTVLNFTLNWILIIKMLLELLTYTLIPLQNPGEGLRVSGAWIWNSSFRTWTGASSSPLPPTNLEANRTVSLKVIDHSRPWLKNFEITT